MFIQDQMNRRINGKLKRVDSGFSGNIGLTVNVCLW